MHSSARRAACSRQAGRGGVAGSEIMAAMQFPGELDPAKDGAPEELEIDILESRTAPRTPDASDENLAQQWNADPGRICITVELEARVVRVIRSADGLVTSEIIRIHYCTYDQAAIPRLRPGDMLMPIPAAGSRVPAFLRRSEDGCYEPAASWSSFDPRYRDA
jgi:hypothetical protein